MNDPELTHKGDWSVWFGAVFICILNIFYILFADKLFRWNLAFQIRNASYAEPSDWEIAVDLLLSYKIVIQRYHNDRL